MVLGLNQPCPDLRQFADRRSKNCVSRTRIVCAADVHSALELARRGFPHGTRVQRDTYFQSYDQITFPPAHSKDSTIRADVQIDLN